MSTSKYIRPLVSGATIIPVETINGIIDSVNSRNVSGIDPTTAVAQIDDGRSVQDILHDTEADYPFKIEPFATSQLSITKGAWNRNQTEVNITAVAGESTQDEYIDTQVLIDFDDFLPSKVADIPYYVYVELVANTTSTTLDLDPALIPGELNIKVTSDANVAHKRDVDYLYTNGASETRDFWIKDKEVIGVVTLGNSGTNWYVSSITQDVSADIIDGQIVPDSISKTATVASHARSTLEHNVAIDEAGSGTIHFGELQLHEVNNCAGNTSSSLPYFKSSETNNTLVGPAGELLWGAIDNHYLPQGSGTSHQTIEIWQDADTDNKPIDATPYSASNSFKVIGLKNAMADPPNGPPSNSYSMGYIESSVDDDGNQMQGELKWSPLDKNYSTTSIQRSIEIKNIANYGSSLATQIYGFDQRTTHTLDSNDRLMIRDDDGGTGGAAVKYGSADNIGSWIKNYWSGWSSEIGTEITNWWGSNASHSTLMDIALGTYRSHDHGNYWQNVDSTNGKYSSASWDFLVNNGSSIGDATKAKVIDLDNRQLTKSFWAVTDITEAGAGTGAFTIAGGLSVAKRIRTESIVDATAGDGSLITKGGASIAKKLRIEDTTVAGAGSGAFICLGGASIAKVLRIEDTTEAGAGTGALISLGGLYTAKKIYAVGDIRTNGDYYQGTNQGETGQGFNGGIMTDLSAAETATVTQVYDLMVGWGLL